MLKRIALAVVLVLIVAVVALLLTGTEAADSAFFGGDLPRPLVIAHQGGEGLRPSNTMIAFQNAVDMGVDVLELDIHMTADGVPVVIHDATVDRTTDGSGAIAAMTLSELKGLDAGHYWSPDGGVTYPYRGRGVTVPALEELFIAFPDMPMNIEIKQEEPSMAAAFCQLIREHGMEEKVLAVSFHHQAITEFRDACPEVATSASQDEITDFYLRTFAFLGASYSPRFHAVQVPERRSGIHVLMPRFIRTAQGKNLQVHAWTINELADMERMVDLGVDGIITDYPDRLLQLLGR